MRYWDTEFLVIGHRGAAALEPENTLRGIRQAVQLQVDAIEVDVHQCEEELVIIHDSTLDRTTNGTGKVSEWSFKSLRELDAGLGEKIPTVAEVLGVIPNFTGINFELKAPGTAGIIKCLQSKVAQVLISSAHLSLLHEVRSLDARMPLALVTQYWHSQFLKEAEKLGLRFFCVEYRKATRAVVDEIQKCGMDVLAYTVNSIDCARQLRNIGVRGIFTGNPEQVSQKLLATRKCT